jgi:hypothetical protein
MLATVGCASRTRVELESARVPSVQPADGGTGQNEAEVVDAGAIEIDPQPIATTTTAPPPSTTIDPSVVTTTVPGRNEVDPEIKTMCRSEKRTLKAAIENYRADVGTSPTSEGDLVAFAYVRTISDLYDLRVDGSIVVQGDTCAGVH